MLPTFSRSRSRRPRGPPPGPRRGVAGHRSVVSPTRATARPGCARPTSAGADRAVRKKPSVRNTARMPVAARRSPASGDQARGDGLGSLRSSLSSIPRVNSTMPLSCDPSAAALTIGVSIRKSSGGGARRRSRPPRRCCRAAVPRNHRASRASPQARDEDLATAPAKSRSDQSQTSIPASKARKRGGRQPGQRLGQQRHVAQPSTRSEGPSGRSWRTARRRSHGSRDTAPEPGIDHAEGGDELQEAARDQHAIGVMMVLSTRPTPAETNAQTHAAIHAARRRRTSSS